MFNEAKSIDKLTLLIQEKVPTFQIKDKNKSFLMKFVYIISFMWIWNRNFFEYITTVNNTIYAPGGVAGINWSIMAHEYVHIMDKNQHGILLFAIKYFFPQMLSIFSLFALLAFVNSWCLLFLLFLLFLVPWPASFRKQIEMRGYAANLLCNWIIDNDEIWIKNQLIPALAAAITDWGYYKMSWSNNSKIEYEFNILFHEIEFGLFHAEEVYNDIINSAVFE